MHAQATLFGNTLAETSAYEFVEGNVYFPPSSLQNRDAVFKPSAKGHTTWCPWKGTASYYDLHVDGQVIENGAWYYAEPLEKATHIRDHVAFYKGKVQVDKE